MCNFDHHSSGAGWRRTNRRTRSQFAHLCKARSLVAPPAIKGAPDLMSSHSTLWAVFLDGIQSSVIHRPIPGALYGMPNLLEANTAIVRCPRKTLLHEFRFQLARAGPSPCLLATSATC